MQLSFMSWLLFFQQLPWRVRFGQLASLCNKWSHPAGRSHVSHPGSREASSQFSGCQGPQGKVPPRKRTHNPVNHTGRTGWFCSTFLIAHILLFLSDWKKKSYLPFGRYWNVRLSVYGKSYTEMRRGRTQLMGSQVLPLVMLHSKQLFPEALHLAPGSE